MRLIDADNLKKELDAWVRILQRPEFYNREETIYIIDNATTIDPVVHGRWLKVAEIKHNAYETCIDERCSICGREVNRYDTQPQDNFCPTCGVKMDAEVENDT